VLSSYSSLAVRSRGWLAALLALLLLAGPVAAQEPRDVPYAVTIEPTGDDQLDAAAAATSQLALLRESAPTTAFGLIGRARGDVTRLQDALRSEGYWGGSVSVTLAGEPPDAVGLEQRLEARSDPVPVVLRIERGTQYRIARIAVRPNRPEDARPVAAAAERLTLHDGDPARAAPILDAEQALLDAVRRAGYPLASVVSRDATVDHDRHDMEVTWVLAAGPRANFAPPVVSGEERTDPGLLARVARRNLTDGPYDPERVERARRALMALGVFESVRSEPAAALDPEGRFPVSYVVKERRSHVVGVSAAYETNYGPTARVYWEHRNLFGGAERLRLSAEISRLGEDGWDRVNYALLATLRTPEVLRRDFQSITTIGLVRERLDAYDRDAFISSAIFERRLTDRITLQAGPQFETGRIGRDEDLRPFSLVGFTMGARWDSTDSLLNPGRGIRAAVTATPWFSVGGEFGNFTRLLATGSTYFDLLGEKRGVLALRASLGSAVGATRDDITLDKRFYAGGGGSVRGYTYQSIGPRDARNRPLGGASLVELSVEWRQRIWREFGGVVFVDAGAVGPDATPDLGQLRVGAGVGLRYLTAIGPIRLDIGFPLNPQPGDSSYGLYVGLGQAF